MHNSALISVQIAIDALQDADAACGVRALQSSDEVGWRHDVYHENATYGYHFVITITYQAL